MDAIEVIKIIGDMGYRFYKDELDHAILYFINMMKDNRVIIINEDGKPCSVLTFSITDFPDYFLKKGEWDYVIHDPKGKIVYVEKIVSYKWNKELRLIFETMVASIYPQIECGVWHRYGDRKVVSKRRIQNVRN